MKRVAMFLYVDSFESWFEKVLHLSQKGYLESYRNDWVWYYAAGLQDNGIDVFIYIPSLKYSGLYETHDGIKVRFLPLESWYQSVTRIPFFKRFPIGTYLQEGINALAFKKAFTAGLNEDQISLLYIQEYWTARFDFLVQQVDIPVIGSDHGGNDSIAFKFIKRNTFSKTCKLECQTLEEVEKVKALNGDAVLLSNGVNTDFFYPISGKQSSSEKTIFTVARLTDKQKRTSDLIKALTYLDPEWSLEIAGTGPDLDSLKALASNLKVLERVRFLGFINDREILREKYNQCSIFAFPSAWEGFALAPLEAMSCGAAVVVSDIPSFKSLISDGINGVKVPIAQPEILAQGIIKCYENRHSYGAEARKTVLNSFSSQKTFFQLAELIKSCRS